MDGGSGLVLDSNSLPLAAQRTPVGTIGVTETSGSILVESNNMQTWVLTTLSAHGRYSASYNGIPVAFRGGAPPAN